MSIALARVIVALVTAALVATVSSGSVAAGSPPSNGVASESADAIVAAALAAGAGARAVHAQGIIKSEGLAFDLWVGARGGRGHLDEGGVGFDFIRAGSWVYFKGGIAFWRKSAGRKFAPFASLFANRWMKATLTNSDFKAFTPLTELPAFVRSILGNHGKLAKGKTSVLDGQPVIAVVDTSDGSTLYVATTGKPYPLRIDKPGKSGGALTFTRWGAPLRVAAPKRSIDISAFIKTHH